MAFTPEQKKVWRQRPEVQQHIREYGARWRAVHCPPKPDYHLSCHVCGTEFSHKMAHAKTCSDECRRVMKLRSNSIRKRSKAPLDTRSCRVCGNEFTVYVTQRNCACSPECAAIFDRERRAAHARTPARRAADRAWKRQRQDTIEAMRELGLIDPPGKNTLPRDQRGWSIPREGTDARRVYDLYVEGHKPREIATLTGIPLFRVNRCIQRLHYSNHNANRTDAIRAARELGLIGELHEAAA